MNDLSLIAINLTRRCNLTCAHCYLDADTLKNPASNELSTTEVCGLLDQIKQCGTGTMVVLTGGEPLLRKDIEVITAYGARLDLAMVVGTNGMLLTEKRVASLKHAGVLGVGISVDSLDPQYHDSFRGMRGAWNKTMDGIENCRRQGLDFQIHFSVTESNANELEPVIDFARTSGARVLNVFFLICTGRGESVTDITPEKYEQVLRQLIDAQKQVTDLIIRARCAPHFKRIAHQLDPDSPINRISGREADACIAGIHYCRITPEGGVTACPYISTEVGNIRSKSFLALWGSSNDFIRLRAPKLQGKCGACEYQQLCGGCRARPVALGQDLMAEDPLCVYQPKNGDIIQPLSIADCGNIHWSPQAKQRISRIPSFLRKMIKKRAEAYVLGIGEQEVTTKHLSMLAAKRFGNKKPERPRMR